ncbi:MAG: lipopolysaccharide heptosyltransferase II [Bdellovibrionota bacterium]|jgi:heptosyltransferase-2
MKILIVQTSFLGDVILSSPVIAAVKSKFPQAEISVLTTPAAKSILSRDPLISEALVFDKRHSSSGLFGLLRKAKELRAKHFDMAFALQRSIRTALLLKFAKIPEIIGFSNAKFSPIFYDKTRVRPMDKHDVLRNLSIILDPDELETAPAEMRLFPPKDNDISEILKNAILGKERWVVLAPGSVWKTKRWSADGFKDVLQQLRKKGIDVFVVGGAEDKELAEEICINNEDVNLAGKLSLSDTMYLISKAAVLVCNDSMPMHLGSAFKIPTVAIFCATSPSFGFGPWKNRAIIVEKEGLSCKPCARHGSMKCPNGTNACIDGISATTVMEAIESLLKEEND